MVPASRAEGNVTLYVVLLNCTQQGNAFDSPNVNNDAVQTHRALSNHAVIIASLFVQRPPSFPQHYSAASQSHLSLNSHRVDHTSITVPRPAVSAEITTMNNAAKKFGLSFLFLCCAGLAVALPSTPDTRPDNTISVRTLRGYLMIAEVCINDRGPFDFLVDTGSNTTLLDPELAAELGLHAKDKLQLASLSSAVGVPRYFLGKLSVGAASLSNLEALALPLTQLRALDDNIRGVLGMNFLLHFSFRLDFDRPALELYSFPETARVPAGLRVPVEINQARLLIPVASSAAPHGSWRLTLDSGISQLLIFEDRMASTDEAPCNESACLMQVTTNLSQQQAATRLLSDVSISDARLPEQEVVVLRNDQQKSTDPQDGLLPAAPFRSVFFDRATATVIFSPAPGATSMAALQNH